MINIFKLRSFYKINATSNLTISKIYYIKASKNLGLAPQDCIVVEDAVSGIESARTAGIGKIIAIASMESTDLYKNIPAVSQIIKNFDEIDRNIFEIPCTK